MTALTFKENELHNRLIVAEFNLEQVEEELRRLREENETLRARLAQPEPDDGYCQACDGDSCTAKEGCVARDNPPPQRGWQGLTDEEVIKLGGLDKDSDYFGLWYDFARAIEAKLKEKNGF